VLVGVVEGKDVGFALACIVGYSDGDKLGITLGLLDGAVVGVSGSTRNNFTIENGSDRPSDSYRLRKASDPSLMGRMISSILRISFQEKIQFHK